MTRCLFSLAIRHLAPVFTVFTLLCLLLPASSPAQVQTGFPPFASFGGPPDTIDLANLNVHYTIPILHKAGRGTDFAYDGTYDSYVWTPITSGSTASWQPVPYWGWGALDGSGIMGYITYNGSPSNCYVFGAGVFYYDQFTNFVFYDARGTPHPLPGQITAFNQSPPGGGNCPSANYGISGTTSDGSGLGYSISTTQQNYNSITFASVSTPSGRLITPPVITYSGQTQGSGTLEDRNGNLITQDGSGHYYDTLSSSAAVLTLAGSGTPSSPLTFTYTPPAGGTATYTVKYTAYTVKTNFGCGIAEYGPTSNNLVSEIDLPDGSKYTFSYESTPGYSGDVTGRLYQVGLPTGGTITYTYSGGNNGINCSDGSTATLTRATPDGTWTYAQAKGSGAASGTTLTDPSGNVTTIQFQGIYETQRSSSTLLTRNTCYNGASSPCTGTAITLPITQRTVTSQFGTPQSKAVFSYNNLGLLTEEDDYDFPSGSALLKKTVISYASLGNIQNMPSSVQIINGSGTTVSQTTYNYDETSVAGTSGTPQHGSGYNGGNLTSIHYPAGGLTAHFTYFDTGNVQTATDVNGAQTTYSYSGSSCGNSFPTSISEPLGLSRSMAWNCTGGVQTSVTDENNQTTSIAYTSDPYFWRPNAVTDPLNNRTSFTYQPNSSYCCPWMVDSAMLFNNNNSIVEHLQYKDGLGRTYVDQQNQKPGSTTLDTVSYTFDSNGRPYSVSMPCSVSYTQTCPSSPATTQTYDALNRPLVTTDGGGGTITYTYSQNDVLVTIGPAPSGEHTKQKQYEYDGLGRIKSVCEVTNASGSGSCGQANTSGLNFSTAYVTQYTYDALGNLKGVTQSGQTRSYGYDAMSRLTSEANPESGTTSYTYDSDSTCGNYPGDLVKRIDANGNVTCYHYDGLHRVTSITYPSGPNAAATSAKTFLYDSTSFSCATGANVKGRLAEAYTGPSRHYS